jgi:hypothetical protein
VEPVGYRITCSVVPDDLKYINTGNEVRDWELRQQAQAGSTWVCAQVTVEARIEVGRREFVLRQVIHGARYDSADDFKAGILYDGVKEALLRSLWELVEEANLRGHAARTALMARERGGLHLEEVVQEVIVSGEPPSPPARRRTDSLEA